MRSIFGKLIVMLCVFMLYAFSLTPVLEAEEPSVFVGNSVGEIFRANLHGDEWSSLYVDQSGLQIIAIAVDSYNEKVYWSNSLNEVYRMNYDGSWPERLLLPGPSRIDLLEVDGVNGRVFFSVAEGDPYDIYSASLDLSSPELFAVNVQDMAIKNGQQKLLLLTSQIDYPGIYEQAYNGTTATKIITGSPQLTNIIYDWKRDRIIALEDYVTAKIDYVAGNGEGGWQSIDDLGALLDPRLLFFDDANDRYWLMNYDSEALFGVDYLGRDTDTGTGMIYGKYAYAPACQPHGLDSDGDGTADCADSCPDDAGKVAPGVCGCGVSDVDSDEDGISDCQDSCPGDPTKTIPGSCGCGKADSDSDGDGVKDCEDLCYQDSAKTTPGVCGCGIADVDSDGDGALDCHDQCSLDPVKQAPGLCGCNVTDPVGATPETVTCADTCPEDPLKNAPGICGCGVSDADTDADGIVDCEDTCLRDAKKVNPGVCGCNQIDTLNKAGECMLTEDSCPDDPNKAQPGICGCGVRDADSDGDGSQDCIDTCSLDPLKQTSQDFNYIVNGRVLYCECGTYPGGVNADPETCMGVPALIVTPDGQPVVTIRKPPEIEETAKKLIVSMQTFSEVRFTERWNPERKKKKKNKKKKEKKKKKKKKKRKSRKDSERLSAESERVTSSEATFSADEISWFYVVTLTPIDTVSMSELSRSKRKQGAKKKEAKKKGAKKRKAHKLKTRKSQLTLKKSDYRGKWNVSYEIVVKSPRGTYSSKPSPPREFDISKS